MRDESLSFGGVGVPGQHATLARPNTTLARNITGETPAQATGRPALNDVPVAGPTDPGILKADCWFAQNRLPAHSACVDCEGPIPMWAQTKGLLGEQISFGSRGALGFALGAAGDPEVYTKFSAKQQAWIADTMIKLNALIIKGGKSPCSTWGPAIPAMAGCIQAWFNDTYSKNPPAGIKMPLRTDGTFDQDTFYALARVAADHPTDFPTPFPGVPTTTLGAPAKGLSTGAMWGLGTAGAAVIGGIIYAATRKKKRRGKR